MSVNTDAAKKKRRLQLLGGGCLALLVSSCCLCVGGGGGLITHRTVTIQSPIEDWMTAVRSGDDAAAFALMAQPYRDQYGQGRFRRKLRGDCVALTSTSNTYEIRGGQYGERRVHVDVVDRDGDVGDTVFWVRDDHGEERIWSISVTVHGRMVCRIAPRAGTPL